MSTIRELITICQESSKINDFRVTHIQILKATSEYFRTNHSETNNAVLVSIKGKAPIISSWSYNERVTDAYKRASIICAAEIRKSGLNSVIVVWNTSTDRTEVYTFNVDTHPANKS